MADSYLLNEDGGFILNEDGGKIVLEAATVGAIIRMLASLGAGS
jgi:hypothetical protein